MGVGWDLAERGAILRHLEGVWSANFLATLSPPPPPPALRQVPIYSCVDRQIVARERVEIASNPGP